MENPMLENAVTIVLGEAEMAALDRFIRDSRPAQTREQALSKIVAAWAAAQLKSGQQEIDEGMRPDELNASNDV